MRKLIVAWDRKVPIGYRRDMMYIPEQGDVPQPAVVIRQSTRKEYLAHSVNPKDRAKRLKEYDFRYFYEVSTD